jgi:hypothetical protein
MEQVTPFIAAHAEGSITTTIAAIRPMFQKGTCGNSKI